MEKLNLPWCEYRLWQKFDTKSVYCKWKDRGWISAKNCENCELKTKVISDFLKYTT